MVDQIIGAGKSASSTQGFWQEKALHELSREEWESLCDGCGLCCLQKLQDDETEEIFYTSISCRFLNIESCRCSVYEKRFEYLPECLNLTVETFQTALPWLPPSCAYKRVFEGKPLADWHPLISGNRQAIHQKKRSVKHFAISEAEVAEDDWQDNLIDLLELED
jgi:uncharacterized cysteine cluster protein YcgN (CxxCxxCC family)